MSNLSRLAGNSTGTTWCFIRKGAGHQVQDGEGDLYLGAGDAQAPEDHQLQKERPNKPLIFHTKQLFGGDFKTPADLPVLQHQYPVRGQGDALQDVGGEQNRSVLLDIPAS